MVEECVRECEKLMNIDGNGRERVLVLNNVVAE